MQPHVFNLRAQDDGPGVPSTQATAVAAVLQHLAGGDYERVSIQVSARPRGYAAYKEQQRQLRLARRRQSMLAAEERSLIAEAQQLGLPASTIKSARDFFYRDFRGDPNPNYVNRVSDDPRVHGPVV